MVLSPPGLREAIRPEEGYGLADLAPEYYDYLAPERADAGTPPTIPSDVYSAGCLWWHLLTGRPPVPGGSSLAKLRGHQTADIPDVCQLAPDTPLHLAAAIRACCQREPESRPESMARLSRMLGIPTGPGRTRVARCMTRHVSSAMHSSVSVATIRRPKNAAMRMAALAGCAIVAVALFWSTWPRQGTRDRPAISGRETVNEPAAN